MPMPKSSSIHTRVDEATRIRIREMAERFGVRESDIIRWALTEYVNRGDKELVLRETPPAERRKSK